MSVVPQVACRQCGTKFSVLRGRCPKCGAQYVKQSARPARPAGGTGSAAGASARSSGSAGGETPQSAALAKWQLIFGAILVVAVIAAVIVLVSASLNAKEPEKVVETPEIVETTPPPTTPPPTPTPTPTIAVTSLTIQTAFNGQTAPDSFTQRTSWSPVQLKAVVYPTEALNDAKVIWHSSDEAVCTVDETGLVTAVGPGSCEIVAECGGVAQSVNVLVPS